MNCPPKGAQDSSEVRGCSDCGTQVNSKTKLRRNWLYWLGMGFVAVGLYCLIYFIIRAVSEPPEIASVYILSGGFISMVFAGPGLFLVWRSQRVPAADLRYQPIARAVAEKPHFSLYADKINCPGCGYIQQTREWPTHGDNFSFSSQAQPGERGVSLKVSCAECKEDFYVVWNEYSGEVKPLTYPRLEIKAELKSWGKGLVAIGVLSILFSGILNPFWGGILVILGVLSFVISRPWMFITIGCSLMLVGVMNLSAVLLGAFSPGGAAFWGIFSCLQLYWGIQELRKYGKYRKLLKMEPPLNNLSVESKGVEASSNGK